MIDVEPRLREELERWQPLVEVPRRWDDVLLRAGYARPSPARALLCRRRFLVVVGAAVVLVVTSTAFAIGREFFVGDPAPPDVKK